MEDCDSSLWFAAQIKPNSQNIAKNNLDRQGFKNFLPQQEVTQKRSGKFFTHLRPLFPGYIFVALSADFKGWRAVNSTYGINKLVSFGNDPSPLPRDLVTLLMLRCDENGKLLPTKLLKPGDQVTLTKGPFADFVATIESIGDDRRIWVLFDLMGACRRVAVAHNQLQLV